MERADAPEAAARSRAVEVASASLAQAGESERDMKAAATAAAERAAAAEARAIHLEKKLEATAAARVGLSHQLAGATAEAAEARGTAAAARDALEDAYVAARANATRENVARHAQAVAEARLVKADEETSAAWERAAAADDLAVRAETAETRLEAAVREGARAVARAQVETNVWRVRASEQEKELEALRVTPYTAIHSPGGSGGSHRHQHTNPHPHQFLSPPSGGYVRSSALVASAGGGAYSGGGASLYPQLQHPHHFSYSSPTRGAGPGSAAVTPAPSVLTADFLDSLGSRLSSVRDLLATSPRGGGY